MRSKTKKTWDASRRNGDAGAARSGPASSKPGRRPAESNNPASARKRHERYMDLARTAEATGDSAGIENLYQHAEHYFRLMREQAV